MNAENQSPAPAPELPADLHEAFEAWVQAGHPGAAGKELIGKEENSPHPYVYDGIRRQWRAWKAGVAWAHSQAPAVAHGWQPIETAPKDGTMLLLAGDNFGDPQRGQHVTVGSWRNERGWWEGLPDPVAEQMTANTQLQNLTHWMPLPEAPVSQPPVQGMANPAP